MDEVRTDAVPRASAAAWSPTAAPAPRGDAPLLTLELPEAAPVAAAPAAPPAPDRLAALRDLGRRLRTAPEREETLQSVIDLACACTGSDAGMLTVQAPAAAQYVCGSALGAGPYISLPLRAGGPSFGELVLTRLAGAGEYGPHDETFAELVAEQVAKAVAAMRAGTVVSQDAQDFIDRVTQELRAPLAGAVAALDAALGGVDAAATARYVAGARVDVGRLLGTVEDLLALAHLRAPELRHMEAVPVTPWMERAVARFRPEAQRRGVTLTHRAAPEAYLVTGRPDQLDLALAHLVANGVRYTEAGGRVDVTAGLIDGLVRVSVRDTGIGFDGADAARLTERFARGLTAEAARIPGLGLGLHLAGEIAGFHHGRLWLESRRDEGTQAHLALPPRRD